jgi:D-3-phosphoglycerate dehydrogenase
MERMKVLVKDDIAEKAVEILKKNFDVDVLTKISQEEFLDIIGKYDALIIRSATIVTADVIEKSERLKIIGRAGIGVDNVDINTANKKGIIVANAPQSNIISAAEQAIALMFALCRRTPEACASLKSGKWERSKFKGIEIYGKTLGVVGFGRIGTLVAQKALGLGMKVMAYDPFVADERFSNLGVVRANSLDNIYRQADVISIHLPKNKDTHHLINEKAFSRMKKGVIIINTARGTIIDEKALEAALKSGQVGGAGLDVYEVEPCTNSPLFALPNVVCTPHLGASTVEAQDKAGIQIAEQVKAALLGQSVSTAVNIPQVSQESMEELRPFMPLGENLGKLFISLFPGNLNNFDVEYYGSIAGHDTRLLTTVVLKGLLEKFEDSVNLVNAPFMAKERGIEVRELKSSESKDYMSMIVLKGKYDLKEFSVSGTLMGKNNQQKFVSINGFELDLVPTEHMAFFKYKDVPGVIGTIGTILGRHNINIANMQVSRTEKGGVALNGINVDQPISPEVLEEIKVNANIKEAVFIKL